MTLERISVGLRARRYDVLVGDGLLDDAGALIAPLLERPRVVVVTDENVRRAQGDRLDKALAAAGIDRTVVALAPGEATKSFAELARLVETLAALEVDRRDLIVAFGGGVVGDIAGFAAAILRRGCRYVQAPTSLLAQVDSAVGGKTAVNLAAGKNLAGAFHQPALVIADIAALASLPQRQLRAGYAEIVKYAALGDAGFFAWLQEHGARLLAGDAAARIEAVRRCCAMKAAIVERDETERGERALLNLGHTFGHAMEAALDYGDALLHGEAVAAGMGMAFDYSVRQGSCAPEDAARLKAHLKACGLPCGPEDVAGLPPAAKFLELMRQDKKVAAGRMMLVLSRGIGSAFIAPADASDLHAFLKDRLKTGK